MDPTNESVFAFSSGHIVLILMIAVPLAFVTSLFLLWIYLHAVKRSMQRRSTPETLPKTSSGEMARSATAPERPLEIAWINGDAEKAKPAGWAPLWLSTAIYVAGGLAFAAVLAVAYVTASGLRYDPVGMMLLTALYSWPLAITIGLVTTISWTGMGLVLLIYLLVLAIPITMAVINTGVGVTDIATVWWNSNARATALCLFFLARPIRAVGPLVAAFMIAAVAGAILIVLAVSANPDAMYAVAWIGTVLRLGAIGTPALLLATGAAIAGLIGWLLLRWLGGLYRAHRISDQSILIDAIWLAFAIEYGMSMTYWQSPWSLAALAAFLAYKWVTGAGFWLMRKRAGPDADAPELLLLRVFSLGSRSARLFDGFAKLWRYKGSIRMIAGPDLATSTVEPHEFLDFMAGRLQRRFITGPQSLTQRLAETEPRRDFDGRFRSASFFCHDDTWKMALGELARDSEAVLMDLRGFTRENRGCLYEIEELLDVVPLHRDVFVVDRTTDEAFLTQAFTDGWAKISSASPNRSNPAPRVQLYRLDGRLDRAVPQLIAFLLGTEAPVSRPEIAVAATS